MINFLKNNGITESVIKNILDENSSANLYNFSCNQDEVIKIIQFLKDIGVTKIEQLLVYRIDKFFVTLDDFKKKYVKDDVDKFAKLINEDYMNIDNL